VIGSFGNLGTVGVAGQALGYDIFSWDYWAPNVASAVFTGWAAVQLYIRQFPPPGTLKPQDPPAGPQ